ncbi:MAG: TonB-dependent receptor [Acidobacteria bacterium]|nr:TonB-dependent receptor [Acidobacteriota bacterium]
MSLNNISNYNLIFSLLFLTQLFSLTTYAQENSSTGSIFGTVKDAQGAVIVGAQIKIKDLQIDLARNILSQKNGSYQLLQLRPSNYEITVEANGFKTETFKTRVLLGVISINHTVLQVDSSPEEIIEVRDNENNQDQAPGSTNIREEEIQNLPVNKRSFLDFSLTAARVTPDRLPAQGAIATSGLSFNGQTARQNNISIDGLNNNFLSAGSLRTTFSQEAVQEYQILSDGYSSEFGRALGGIVNIITKRGSNSFHGSNFFFLRNDELSARDAFLSLKPDFKQYQFGATLSGPIKINKVFFFSSFERLSSKQNNIVRISDSTISSIRRIGFPITKGAIPVANAISSALVRLDYYLTPKDAFTLRYNFAGNYVGDFEPFGGLKADTSAGRREATENVFAINNVYSNTTSSFINETRFLFSRLNFNIEALAPGPQVQIVAPEGLVSFGRAIALPEISKDITYQLINNSSLLIGNHQIKFGFDFLSLNIKKRFTVTESGIAIFAPIDFAPNLGQPSLTAFSGLQAFDPFLRTPAQKSFLTQLASIFSNTIAGFPLIDLASQPFPLFFQQGFPPPNIPTIRPKLFSFFFQDNIKLKPELLLNLGLRYDLERSANLPNNNGNFSPRINITYSPNFNRNLQLHSSYGLFFGLFPFGIEFTLPVNTTPNFFFLFPFSVQAFMQPSRNFSSIEAVPPNIPLIKQLSVVPDVQPNIRASYTQQINAGFNYKISKSLKLAIDYNFIRGIKLIRSRDINPVINPIPNNPVMSLIVGRSDPSKGSTVYFEGAADSYYNALSASVGGQVTKNFSLLMHYTFSKSIDNYLDFSPLIGAINPIDPLNPGRERSLSIQDVRSRFVLSGNWDFAKQTNPLLRDFSLSTVVTLESGKPYNLIVGSDFDMNGDFPPSDRPLGISRNAGITPGFANVDLRLTRLFKLNEKVKIKLTLDTLNLFNKVNISNFNSIFPPDKLGRFNLPRKKDGRFIVPKERFLNAFSSRQLQFGVNIIF